MNPSPSCYRAFPLSAFHDNSWLVRIQEWKPKRKGIRSLRTLSAILFLQKVIDKQNWGGGIRTPEIPWPHCPLARWYVPQERWLRGLAWPSCPGYPTSLARTGRSDVDDWCGARPAGVPTRDQGPVPLPCRLPARRDAALSTLLQVGVRTPQALVSLCLMSTSQ